jgi:hypothetical protein
MLCTICIGEYTLLEDLSVFPKVPDFVSDQCFSSRNTILKVLKWYFKTYFSMIT